MKHYLRILLPLCLVLLLAFCGAAWAESESESEIQQAEMQLFTSGEIPMPVRMRSTVPEDFADFMAEQLRTQPESIVVIDYAMQPDAFVQALSNVVNENPDLFYIGPKVSYSTGTTSGNVYRYYPEYLYTGEELQSRIAAYEASVAEIAAYARSVSDHPLAQMMAVNDYFCVHYTYDDTLTINRPDLLFSEKTGVCQAYMLGYAAVLDELGIENTHATSYEMVHTWNLVNLDGQWYHVDVTWNDSTDTALLSRYRYFLLSDDGMTAANHENWTAGYAAADTTYDAFFWQQTFTPMGISGEDIFYLNDDFTDGNRTICRWSIGETDSTQLHSFDIKAADGSYLVSSAYNPIAVTDTKVYYGARGNLYKMNHDGSSVKLVRSGDDSAYIWSCWWDGADIRMLTGDTSMGSLQETSFPCIHDVDASRISVELPDGLVADVAVENGILRVEIDDAASDWQRVLCSGGGYPYVCIRPTIQKPNEAVTGHYGFNGGINSVSEDYIIRFLENDIASYESDHLTWSNGEDIGEVVAERALFMPRSSGNPDASPDTWGGTVICWVDSNDPSYRYYEQAVFCISHKSDESFHVPLRFVSAETLVPVYDLALPANVELTRVENGEVTFTLLGEAEDESDRLSVPMQAPEGAVYAYLVHEGGYQEEISLSDGIATIGDIDYQNISRVDERQYTVIWKDEDGNLLDYGLLWVHIIPMENDPWACYVENWQPVDPERVIIENGADGCGVEVSYAAETGISHIGYDNAVSISKEPGSVGIYVVPPEGAACLRSNRSGGNVIMGRDERVVNEQHNIVLMQDYQTFAEDENICIRDNHPFREVNAGPVSIYIQDTAVWPYGGSVNLLYWYDSVESAEEDPENPMLIEYICETSDTLCQVKRSSLVSSEEQITEPVTEITAVGDYGGWKLVVKRYPQKGSNAFHWDLQLENETGVYQPLSENMVFYVPYPKGHDNHTTYSYELRHYDDDHGSFSLVDVRRTEYGLRFEVSSLSPFVFAWYDPALAGGTLTLPAALSDIREEAFLSLYVETVALPDGVERIESRAFAECRFLKEINIPASVSYIAKDAFEGCQSITLQVVSGSYGENYAMENGISYISAS